MRTQNSLTAGLIALALAAHPAHATTLRRMTLDELTAAASVVARVRCLGSETRFERGEIWTLTRFEVKELLKGSAPAEIIVRLIGGRVGHLIATVDGVPRFASGEDVILFLEPTPGGELTVTSWVQGTFRVRRDPHTGRESVAQDTSGLAVFDPATRTFRPGGIRNLPLEEFHARVSEAVARNSGRRK
jgi:hypothetical protein